MNNNETKKLISLILNSVGLAMGVAVLVLNILGNIENDTSIRLLSLGVIAYGLHLLQNKTN